MHNLEINRGRIFIDGFEIKNVTGYNLKSSGKKRNSGARIKVNS